MKRLLTFLCLLVYGLQAQGQNALGFYGIDTLSGGFHFTSIAGQAWNTGFVPADTLGLQQGFEVGYSNAEEMDSSRGRYFIGFIPEINLFQKQEAAFYYCSDTIPAQVRLSYKLSRPVQGLIQGFDSLIYINDTVTAYIAMRVPDTLSRQLAITFIAKNTLTGEIVDTQRVVFNPLRHVGFETQVFGVGNSQLIPERTNRDYILVTDDSTGDQQYMNGVLRRVRDVEIAGIDVRIDQTMPLGPANVYARFNSPDTTQNANIRSLTIYAERLYINDPIRLPGTNVKIFAREVHFIDRSVLARSAINTTPHPVFWNATQNQVQGLPGTRGGGVELYCQSFYSDAGFRFIANGGKGQNGQTGGGSVTATQNGDAAPGGDFYSSLDLEPYADLLGSASGEGGPPANILRGGNGKFHYTADTVHWLHANYSRLALKYAEDLYMLGKTDSASLLLYQYVSYFDNFINTGNQFPTVLPTQASISRAERGMNLSVVLQQMVALERRIETRLDYYGNPPGWVPMLSLDLLATAYDNQINAAFDVLYLSNFIKNSNKALQSRVAGLDAMVARLNAQITGDNNAIADLVTSTHQLDDKVTQNLDELNTLANELKALEADFANRARKIKDEREAARKRSFIGGLMKTAGSVLSMIPTPATQIAGAGLTVAGGIVADPPEGVIGWAQTGINAFSSIGSAFNNTDYTQGQQDFGRLLGQINPGQCVPSGLSIGQIRDAVECGRNQFDVVKKLGEKLDGPINEITEAIKNNQSNDQELNSILADLRAQEPRYGQIAEETQALQQENVKLANEIQSNAAQSLILSSRIISSLKAVDGISRARSIGIGRINMEMVQYAAEMEKNAFNDLKRFQYYMAKAYEYRSCSPYPGDLNLSSVLNQMVTLVENATNSTLTPAQLSLLKPLYQQQINVITNALVTEFSQNAPSSSGSISFSLKPEQLKALSRDKVMKLNLVEDQGIFANDREDLRILNLRVDSIIAHTVNGGVWAQDQGVVLQLEYPSTSKIKKRGKVFSFNNYNSQTEYQILYAGIVRPSNGNAMDGILTWNDDISQLENLLVLAGQPNPAGTSHALMRPALWADMLVKTDITSGTDRFVLDRVKLTLEYTYRTRPSSMRYLNIRAANADLMPLFLVNRADANGKSDGYGNFFRAYVPNATVNVTAPKFYGKYKFVGWDIGGSLDPNLTRTVTMTSDKSVVAQYVPIVERVVVPDTVYLNAFANGEQLLVLRNDTTRRGYAYKDVAFVTDSIVLGTGIQSTDFYLTQTNGNFGYITPGDTAAVSFTVSRNLTNVPRVMGTIFTFAPEDSQFVHKTVIIQDFVVGDKSTINNSISIFPNPSTTGLFNIRADNLWFNSEIQVFDLTGRLVSKFGKIQQENSTLDLSRIPKGAYIIKIRGASIQKIIKVVTE